MPEQHILGNGDDLRRHQNHHDDDAEQNALALELKAGEAIACQCTGSHLHQRAADVQQKRGFQGVPDVHNICGFLDDIERQVTGDPHDCRVTHVRRIAECTADHVDQRIENDEAKSEQNEEPEKRPHRIEHPFPPHIGDLGFVHALHADLPGLPLAHTVAHQRILFRGCQRLVFCCFHN